MSSDSRVSDYCRLCTTSFKVKFGSNLGKQGHSSSKICSSHHKERIALGWCPLKFVKKLVCRFFISCNIVIGSVIHVAGKFVTWASFTSSLKLQIHPQQVPETKEELYASKEVKENALASEGKSCQPKTQQPQEINKRVLTSQC